MKFIAILALFCLSYVSGAGQYDTSSKKALKLYKQAEKDFYLGNLDKAIMLLNKALTTDPEFAKAHFASADIYHKQGNIEEEMQHLRAGLNKAPSSYPLGYYLLAKLLYDKEKYHQANDSIECFFSISKSFKKEAIQLRAACNFAVTAIENPVPFEQKKLGKGVNTQAKEYWPSINAEGNRLIFTRLIEYDKNGNKLRMPYEDLYTSTNNNNVWSEAVSLGANVNTLGNEGAQCISADGRVLFFTACGRKENKGTCDIYCSILKEDGWTKPVNVGGPVNTVHWESQPSLSADSKTLYFVSNRPGGKGQMDIWRAKRIGVSKEGYPIFGKVDNISEINTRGNEMSPFIHADNKTLYFSSDYWPGMGGNDLFISRLTGNNTFSTPRNMGYPLNTSGDEEGMIVEIDGKKAYYNASSNDYDGQDIYTFAVPLEKRPTPVSYVKGVAVDAITKEPVPVDILLYDLESGEEVANLTRYENSGGFTICLPSGKNYGLSIEQKNYLFHSENFFLQDSFSIKKPYFINIDLQPIVPGSIAVLKNIFFETDSSSIKEESFRQLDNIIRFMSINTSVVIEIGGHTDSTGSESHNLSLSDKRATSVASYMHKGGIPKERVKHIGYGSSKPIANNNTEEGKAKNRRTELKVLK